MSQKKNFQCLMLETKDNQKFFTYEKNYDQIIEIANVLGAEISIVKIKEAEVLALSKLAPAICSTPDPEKKPDFEIIELKLSQNKKNRPKMLKNAKKIKKHIKELFLSKEIVKLADVASKFKRCRLTLACFCNHLKVVRKELEKEGYTIVKIGHGEYKMN